MLRINDENFEKFKKGWRSSVKRRMPLGKLFSG